MQTIVTDSMFPDGEENNESQIEVNINAQNFDITLNEIVDIEEIDEKLISYIEKLIRNSFEYKNYINYLKTELNLTKCILIPTIDINELKVSLEFHHSPMNLYEITETVLKKMLDKKHPDKSISCFDIAEEVMAEHYKNHIGLVPLTSTLHEMAHNKKIFINLSHINGNYKKFLQKYADYINDDIKDRIFQMGLDSEINQCAALNSQKLEKRIVNYNINYDKNEDN